MTFFTWLFLENFPQKALKRPESAFWDLFGSMDKTMTIIKKLNNRPA